jgi:hypothetical protein
VAGEETEQEAFAAEVVSVGFHLGELGGWGMESGAAGTLGVSQAAISKLERRADMCVTTLRKFIEAMGGRLEMRAVFLSGGGGEPRSGDKGSRLLGFLPPPWI